jgi:hypothetical protein
MTNHLAGILGDVIRSVDECELVGATLTVNGFEVHIRYLGSSDNYHVMVQGTSKKRGGYGEVIRDLDMVRDTVIELIRNR